MNENTDKNEKLSSNEDDELITADDDTDEDNSYRSSDKYLDIKNDETDLEEPAKQTLASFFKTKAERAEETDVNQDAIVEDVVYGTGETENIVEEDNLTNTEVQEVTLVVVDSRTQEIGEELATVEPDSVEEFEALAGAVFLESLQELANGDNEVTPELIDAAFDEAVVDLSLDDNLDQETEENPELMETVNPLPVQDIDDDPNAAPTVIQPVVPIPPQTPPVTPPAPPVPTPSVPPVGPNINTVYPLIPPPGGGPPTNYNYGPPLYGPPPATPNSAPVSPNTKPIIIQEIHNHRSDLLLGVIVGYIVGRRGGRKRTEKKLIPKIDKLEEQVKVLHDTIIEKEVLIRKIARESAENIKKSTDKTETPFDAAKILERRKTKKQVNETLKRREILAKDPGVEKIGKFSLPALKVFHERRLPDGTENSPSRIRVEVMNTVELLEKVDGLIIHDLKVTEMHERGRLTEESLRQITKEYLRSGPYEQTFYRELLPDPIQIETLKNQVIEKNTTHSVDETVRSLFKQETSAQKFQASPSSPKKPGIFKSLKIQKQAVVSGIMSALVLAAILVVYFLVR